MSHPSDRPTMPPAFDVERFAKDSEGRLRSVRPADPDPQPWATPDAPQSEIRLQARAEMGGGPTDEGWAQAISGAPVVVMPLERLKRLPLDHRAGFLLSLMDGHHDLDTMVEIAGMRRSEVLRLVRDLFESGVVEFRTTG